MATGKPARKDKSPISAFDSQVSKQRTEGRLRLDSLLPLIRELGDSLEQDVEKTRHSNSSDSLHEQEALNKVMLTLQRFAMDTNLREEFRVLVSLLRSSDRDLTQCQGGLDMALKLIELAEIQAAIEAVDRD